MQVTISYYDGGNMANKPVLLFIYDGLEIGGIETHLVSIAQECNEKKYRMIWAVSKYMKGDQTLLDIMRKSQVETLRVHKINKDRIGNCCFYDVNRFETLSLASNEELFVISFDIQSFFLGESIKKKYSKSNLVHNVFYTPHESMAYRDQDILNRLGNGMIYELYHAFYKSILKKIIANDGLYFMDELHRKYLKKIYGFTLSKEHVIPLGLNSTKGYDENIARKKRKEEVFRLLSIGRVDFPHKEYILGLVDSFQKIAKEYPFTELTVIGYGKDEELLLSKINSLESEVQSRINFVGKIPLPNLPEYISKAHVCIAQGLSLQEAAKEGVVCIVAPSFSKSDQSGGYVHENEDISLAYKGNRTFYQDIKEIIDMNEENYALMCKHTFEIWLENYGNNNIDNSLLRMKNINNKRSVNIFQIGISQFIASVFLFFKAVMKK